MKGKPWTFEEERKLKALAEAHKPMSVIAETLGKTGESIRQKMLKLGLLEQQQLKKSICCSSNDLKLPKELPSVEQALKVLAAAIDALKNPGLDKSEVLRLRSIAQAVKIYQGLLAEYVNYRGIEERLEEVTEEVRQLAKKTENPKSK